MSAPLSASRGLSGQDNEDSEALQTSSNKSLPTGSGKYHDSGSRSDKSSIDLFPFDSIDFHSFLAKSKFPVAIIQQQPSLGAKDTPLEPELAKEVPKPHEKQHARKDVKSGTSASSSSAAEDKRSKDSKLGRRSSSYRERDRGSAEDPGVSRTVQPTLVRRGFTSPDVVPTLSSFRSGGFFSSPSSPTRTRPPLLGRPRDSSQPFASASSPSVPQSFSPKRHDINRLSELVEVLDSTVVWENKSFANFNNLVLRHLSSGPAFLLDFANWLMSDADQDFVGRFEVDFRGKTTGGLDTYFYQMGVSNAGSGLWTFTKSIPPAKPGESGLAIVQGTFTVIETSPSDTTTSTAAASFTTAEYFDDASLEGLQTQFADASLDGGQMSRISTKRRSSKSDPPQFLDLTSATSATSRNPSFTVSSVTLGKLTEGLSVGVFMVDAQRTVVCANEAYWRLTCLSSTLVAIKYWDQNLHPDDIDAARKIWDNAFETKEAFIQEFRWRATRTGMPSSWTVCHANPDIDKDGIFRGFLCSLTDITPQKAAEKREKLAREKAYELKTQQENFMDLITHEIRNPLSAAIQSTEFILTAFRRHETSGVDLDLESVEDSAKTIYQCNAQQAQIVDDVLLLSKMDSSLLRVNPQPLEPRGQILHNLKMYSGDWESKDIDVTFEMEQSFIDLGVDQVSADALRINQIMSNLLSNAIKFTSRRDERHIKVILGGSRSRPSRHGKVIYMSRLEDEGLKTPSPPPPGGGELLQEEGNNVYLQFTVQDSGEGISEEGQKVLFQRFRQSKANTEHVHGGSGLGLFISRSLSQLQGGDIGVYSVEDVGSSFSFYILAKEAQSTGQHYTAGEEPFRRRRSDASSIKPGSSGSLPMAVVKAKGTTKWQVLIAEDNELNLKVLTKGLLDAGCDVFPVNNGRDAVTIVESNRDIYNAALKGTFVILMDQQMPIMNGMDATRAIRKLERTQSLPPFPIIGISANAKVDHRNEMVASGMDDVIAKPFTVPGLLNKLEEHKAKVQAETLAAAAAHARSPTPSSAFSADLRSTSQDSIYQLPQGRISASGPSGSPLSGLLRRPPMPGRAASESSITDKERR